MNMKMTHLFAMHGHLAAGGGMVLLLLVIVAAVLMIVLWPDKSQTK
jgi:multisubunit Na+/H+ antiporter MnhB subunit